MDQTEPRSDARTERRAPRRLAPALLATLAAALAASAACDRRAAPPPPCSGGGACQPVEPCRVGTFACSASGERTCVASGAVEDGTACGQDLVCRAGSCVACAAGGSCTPADPCHLGAVSCATGQPTCADLGTPVDDGTACGADVVCRAGACLACASGAACEPAAGPCHAGTVACGSGAPVCVEAGARPDGTSCGAGLECRAGACQPLTCTSCHGGQDGDTAGAPPRALAAAVASPLAVGAHRAHLGRDVRCEDCHQVPAGVDAPGHLTGPDGSPDGDGIAEVPFPPGSRARLAGAAPAWDRTTATCSGVYCHGATTAAPPPPAAWLGGATTCASCHASPPPSHGAPGSLALTACATCHPATASPDGTIRTGGGHVNGAVEVDSAAVCTACHGDRVRLEPDALLKAAPPAAAAGSPDPGAVGAHAAHLHEGPLSQPFACSSCHQVPAGLDHFETGTRAEIAWDTSADPARNLATRRGATPAWDAASGTCSGVYCHGATLGGGANATPAWTGGAAEVGLGQATLAGRCGACHGAPPAAPHPAADKAGAPLAQAGQCADCHPGTVDGGSGEIAVAGGLHVDGQLDLDFHPAAFAQPASHGPAALRDLGACATCHGATFDGGVGPSCTDCHAASGHPTWRSECTFCHGSAARAPQGGFALAGLPPLPLDQAAPPVGTQGEQTASQVAVGAHLAHLGAGGLSRPVQCTECHGAAPTDSAGHADGSVALAWGALATGGGAIAPTPAAGAATPAWEEAPTCTNACHGAALAGGTNTAPSWTGGPTQAACGTCHAIPLPSTAATGWHVPDPDCGRCHPGSTASTVDAATHVDGAATVVALGCDTCHAAGAPFRATTGATVATDARVGAHDRHLATAIAAPLTCADCHLVPGALRHADGSVALAWGPRAAALGAVPAPPAGPIQPGQPVTCANYCHGATLFPLGTDRTPSWTVALTGCGTCHAPAGAREHRNGPHGLVPCARCHFSVMDAASDTTVATPSLHVNGTGDVQLDPAVLGSSGRFTKVGDTWTCTNLCHLDPGAGGTHSSSVW